MSCATAADDIVKLLRAYDKAFSVRRAPYLISYATYVAATIHARIAARRGPGSHAHRSLETCLAVFRENQETNWAVRRANAIVQNVMKRLGVASLNPGDAQIDRDVGDRSHTSTPNATTGSAMGREASLQSLDIDGIIQSFVREREQETFHSAQTGPTGNAAVSNAHGHVQSQWQYATTEIPSATSHAGQQDASSIPYDSNGTWIFQGQQQIFDENLVTVDDLLYGFNGSELDKFPMLDWDV